MARPAWIYTRNRRRKNGQRRQNLPAEQMEPTAYLPECFCNRRRMHGFNRGTKPIINLYGLNRKGGEAMPFEELKKGNIS